MIANDKRISNLQKGMVLITSIVMLFLLTLIAFASMKNTILQQKMTNGFEDNLIACQSAENAINTAEIWLYSLNQLPIPNDKVCTSFPCVQTLSFSNDPEEQPASWWQVNSTSNITNILPDKISKSQFIIQYLRFVPDTQTIGSSQQTGIYYYLITARGTDISGVTECVIQTTIGLRF